MLSILVVDDEPEICEIIKEFLGEKGHKVRTSQSGIEALKKIEESKPDIVLLDLNMPGMDGEATFKEIKRHYQDIHVVMVTGNSDMVKALRFLENGAFDYIAKPIDFKCLEKCLFMWEKIVK